MSLVQVRLTLSNNDGYPDIASSDTGAIRIYVNKGLRTFQFSLVNVSKRPQFSEGTPADRFTMHELPRTLYGPSTGSASYRSATTLDINGEYADFLVIT